MAADSQSGKQVETTITPLMTFDENIRLTGWQISKYRDADYLLIGTPNSPHDDRDMFQLLFGLSATYMSHLTPNLDTLEARHRQRRLFQPARHNSRPLPGRQPGKRRQRSI